MSVRTGMYHFEVSRTAMYRVRYVLVRTSTYRHVLPCTRCTGFQMITVASYYLQVVRQHEHYLAWQPQAGRAVPGQPAVSRAAAAAGLGPTRAAGDQPG